MNLYVGTSGFGYPAWVPRFYPPGTRTSALLPAYAERLPAVEVNGSFYRMPKPATLDAWLRATPAGFRFVIKALRTGSMRAFATDPEDTLPWLLRPARDLGERLGAVLFRVGPDGRVAQACIGSDELGDAGVRRCVLDAIRATAFPRPDPSGTVDAALPVVLRPDASLRQRPLCPSD